MDDFEILKELKKSYDSILEILDNVYVNESETKKFKNITEILSKLYGETYSKIQNKEENLLKTDLNCPHCKSKVDISDLINYEYLCEECNENFYLGEGELNREWYNQIEDEKLDKSLKLNIDYDSENKSIIISNEFDSKRKYKCETLQDLLNGLKREIYDYKEKAYYIKIWEKDRNKDVFEFNKTYDNENEAIIKAKEIKNNTPYKSIDVIKDIDNLIFTASEKYNTYYFDNIEIREVNKKTLDKYIDNWSKGKKLPISSNLLFAEDNNKFIGIDNTTNDCWTEEFNSKEELFKWFSGKEIEINEESIDL